MNDVKYPLMGVIGFIVLILVVIGLALQHDTNACAERGGTLDIKSAGKGIVELCLTDDGRILY